MIVNSTARKAIAAFLFMLLMAGLYGAIVALCNQYLRNHEMLTETTKYLLGVIAFAGFYFIYKWFSKRIDNIAKH
ncbi:MAG: hypothetical protein K2L84_05430 [Muribaculaceae bacterium]|nr:hypothetical protein [Muribaculaceae bacterium]